MIPNPSKWNCGFCPFKDKKELCHIGISLRILYIYIYKINNNKIMSKKRHDTNFV
jgi:hypothetical protein